MNSTSKSTLQALGYGLAGAAAAAIANETAKRVYPRPSPLAQIANLSFLGRRKRFNNPFGRGALVKGPFAKKGQFAKGSIAGALFSNPLFYNFGGDRNVKRNLLRSALLGIGAGLGSLALPKQKRGFFGSRGGGSGSGLKTIGRLVAGGLVAAAASRLLSRSFKDRRHHDEHEHDLHGHDERGHDFHTHEQFG